MESPNIAHTPGSEIPVGADPTNASLGSSLKDVGSSFARVVRSEIRLAQAELTDAAGDLGRKSAKMAAFGVVAALGILPFLSFLVIGLGRILNDNYWLSSLVVAVVFFAVGGILAYSAFKSLKFDGLSAPRTRQRLDRELSLVKDKVSETQDNIRSIV